MADDSLWQFNVEILCDWKTGIKIQLFGCLRVYLLMTGDPSKVL